MKRLIPALGLLMCSVLPISAKADTFQFDLGVNFANTKLGATEQFASSFLWNQLNPATVSDYSFSSTGPLTGFVGPEVTNYQFKGVPNFQWYGDGGAVFQIYLDHWHPSSMQDLLGGANASSLLFLFGAGNDWEDRGFMDPTGFLHITPVPEPASWLLLAVGIIGVLALAVIRGCQDGREVKA